MYIILSLSFSLDSRHGYHMGRTGKSIQPVDSSRKGGSQEGNSWLYVFCLWVMIMRMREKKNVEQLNIYSPNVYEAPIELRWKPCYEMANATIQRKAVKTIVNINVLVGYLHFSFNTTTMFARICIVFQWKIATV